GILYTKQGKLLDAQGEFEAALRIAPRSPRAHGALSAVFQRQGKAAEAKRELKIAEDQEKLLRAGMPGGSGR
ncbi:MAG: hypothetical protein ACRDGM_06760, partial [bacterium]